VPAWHGLTDPGDIAYVENKGWKGFPDTLRSYRGAESLIGRDPSTLVTLPRSDDPEGFRQLAAKLGMPESADKYEFPVDKDMPFDEGYLGWARGAFHEADLTAAQAKQIAAKHSEFVKATIAKQAEDHNLNVEADKKALQREWGGGMDRMMNTAKMAANALEFPSEVVDAMEEKMGYAATMKFFAKVGQKLGEDSFKGADGGGGPPKFSDQLTPAEAQDQWNTYITDPNNVKALFDNQHPGHMAAKEKQKKLFSIIHGA